MKSMQLFSYTQPELINGLKQNVKTQQVLKDGALVDDIIAVSLTLAKKKDLAAAYGLKVNGAACSAKMRELQDAMKVATSAEFAKLAASDEWTGAGFSIRKGKGGVMRATARLVSVEPKTKVQSIEEVVAALTPEQRAELISMLKESPAPRPPVDVPSQTRPQPEAPKVATKHHSLADGLILFDTTPQPDGNLQVVIGSGVSPEQHTVIMSAWDFADLCAIANDKNGTPEGMDIAEAYSRLEPILANCPADIRPIP